MPELSNSVRQRLGARPAPATHPDADTLTAYVEQVLPAGERGQIVEHLAACDFCREIVALSLPALPEKTMVQILTAPSRFWTFGFRWAGALAVIAIAVALVIERPGHKESPPTQSPITALPTTPHVDSADSTKVADSSPMENAAPVATTSEEAKTRGVSPVLSPRRTATPEPSSDLAKVTSTSPAPPPLGNTARNEAVDLKAVGGILEASGQPRPGAAQQKGFVNSKAFLAEDRNYVYTGSYSDAIQEKAKADAERAKKESAMAFAVNPEGDANARKSFLRKAIPTLSPAKLGPLAVTAMSAVKSVATGASPAADTLTGERTGSPSFAAAPLARPPISPRSVVGSAARITHDSDTPRPAYPAYQDPPLSDTARRAKAAAASEPLHWRVQDGKLVNSADMNQWHEAYPQGDAIEFKVVQAQGHEVWAGGTNGTLVHSWDGGVDWQKLNLGDAAAGDIEKISLSGGDVQVKTSNGQHLISRDGGKTWAPLNPQSKPEGDQPK
jgi:hypothetical protein